MTTDTRRYQRGFGNEFATEAIAGALPAGPQQPAARAVRALCRADLGHRLHGARAANRRTWVYRRQPSVGGRQLPALCAIDVAQRRPARRDAATRAAALEPVCDSRGAARLHRRHAHDRRQRRCRGADRRRGPRLPREPFDGTARLRPMPMAEMLVGAAAGSPRRHDRTRRARRAAGRRCCCCHRGIAFKVALARWPVARLRLREPRRDVRAARTRADRLQRASPRARLPRADRRLRTRRRRARGGEEIRRAPLALAKPAHAIRCRRLARQPRAVHVRHRELHDDRLDQASTIPTRRSSPCSRRRRTQQAPRTATS